MTDTLRGKGYNMQDPATLDKQRQGNVIQCRSGFEREGQVMAFLHVQATVEGFPSDPPAGSDQADCIVVLGT
jgi:phage-related protein